MLEEFDSFMTEFAEKNAGKESPKVLVLMGLPGSYIIATDNSYVGSLVKLAGGTNVYGDGDGQEFLFANTRGYENQGAGRDPSGSPRLPMRQGRCLRRNFLPMTSGNTSKQ